MNLFNKILKIYYLPLFIALIIAISQFVLSSNFSLTRWEGGGFGMYSEPNPNNSRILGISLKNPNGEIHLRLYPLDNKLFNYIKNLEGKKKDNWEKLIEESDRIRTFPKLALTDEYIRKISNELLEINPDLRSKMRSINSPITVYVYINQLNIDIKDKSFQTQKLYSKILEI
ncbi:MAG: hypothetical protein GTO02_07040 [Candidatus Dadabacteria bacterium]|nr:hypothetical protein [Candidatus Dadabacteria bacterium]NIQ14150.1 hypothetical protein [Candidatus Dadabacteria bacterium]